MFNEPIKEQYEKVFYSPDKVKKLIITKNNIGSYSYHVEKLTILEGEEIYWCGNHAFWEPIFGSGLAAYGKLGKLGYAGIQGLINSGIAGGLTAGQGLITGSFSLDSVGLSAMFGFACGAIGITKWGEGVRNIIVGAGLGLG